MCEQRVREKEDVQGSFFFFLLLFTAVDEEGEEAIPFARHEQ